MRTLEVLHQCENNSIRQTFCVLSGVAGDLDDDVRRAGGEMLYLSLSSPAFVFQFLQFCRNETVTVVHSHVHFSSGVFLLLAKIAGVNGRVSHFRSSGAGEADLSCLQRTILTIKRRLIQFSATEVVGVSRSALRGAWSGQYERIRRKAQVLYSGVRVEASNRDVSRRQYWSEFDLPTDSLLYMHVGRFDKPKNHRFLLEVFQHLHQADGRSRLLLVGGANPSEQACLIDWLKSHDLSDKVFFSGLRTDVRELLCAADCVIFPSLWEGLPGSVLESLSVGTPVVMSDIPIGLELQEVLQGITVVSLESSARQWASVSSKVAIAAQDGDYRDIVLDGLASSPFTVEKSANRHKAIWMRYARH